MDRRFNRTRYDAQQEAERFAGRLSEALDLNDLSEGLMTVVASTVQPTNATVWIRADQ